MKIQVDLVDLVDLVSVNLMKKAVPCKTKNMDGYVGHADLYVVVSILRLLLHTRGQ